MDLISIFCLSRRGGMPPQYCHLASVDTQGRGADCFWALVGFPPLCLVSVDTTVGWPHYSLVMIKAKFYWASSDTTPVVRDLAFLINAGWGWKFRIPILSPVTLEGIKEVQLPDKWKSWLPTQPFLIPFWQRFRTRHNLMSMESPLSLHWHGWG